MQTDCTVDGTGLPSATAHGALLVVGRDIDPPGVAHPGVCVMVSPQGERRPMLRNVCYGTFGCGILNLRCTDTICGDRWLQSYVDLLGSDAAEIRGRDSVA